MVRITLHCPFCGSDDVGKNGTSNGKQRYLCRNSVCSRQTFYAEYTPTTVANQRSRKQS